MAVVKNMMVRVGADFSSLTTQSKTAATATKSWAAKTTASFQQVGASSAGLTAATNRVGRFSSMMRSAGSMLLAVFGVQQLINFGRASIEAASDLAEVQNVVDVVFPAMSQRVDEFAQSAAASFGLSETMAKRFVGTFGSMASAMGFTEEQAYTMATTLAGLTGDVASFFNLDQEEAYTKLKSVFTGETEPLRDIGVLMTQSTLDAYALANGYGKTTAAMSELEKVSLRYAYVQDSLADAQGDYLRTNDSWANQIRTLQLNFESLKAVIGGGLISLLTPFVRMLNTALSALVKFGNAVSSVFSAVFGTKKQESSLGGVVLEDLEGYSSGLDDVGSSASGAASAAKELKRQVLGFDEITKLSDQSSGGSSGGGGASGGSVGTSLGSAGGGILAEAAENTNKFTGAMQKFHDWLASLNLTPIQTAWDNLRQSGGNLVEIINGGLQWGLENVLAPLAKWTIEEGAPAGLEALATGLRTLGDAFSVLAPLWDTIWQWVGKPVFRTLGDTLTSGLNTFNTVLSTFDGYLQDIRSVMEGDMTLGEMFSSWVSPERNLNEIGGILGTFSGTLRNALPVSVSLGLSAREDAENYKRQWARSNPIVQIGVRLKNGAKELWKGLSGAWGDAKDHVVEVWDQVKNGATVLWSGISSAWGNAQQHVVEIWDRLKNGAAVLWNGFASGWGSRAVTIFNSLANTASTLWSQFSSGWGSRGVSIINTLANAASTLWNGFASSWGSRGVSIVNTLKNTAEELWRQFKAGWSGKFLSIRITYDTSVTGVKRAVYKALGLRGWPKISFAARGGIVNAATLLGNTVVGEAGREAIVPLENHTEWLDLVAGRVAQAVNGGTPGSSGRPLVVQVVLDGKVVGQTSVNYINEHIKSSGASPLML